MDSIIILMEHTGYLTFLFEKFLIKHDLRYAKVNGLALKRSVGLARGKSDKMDARRIAEYAATNVDKLRFQRPRTKATERLKMLIMERNKCIKMRTGLKNTLEEMSCIHLPSNDLIMRSPQVLINALNRQIKALEKEMDAVIREDRDLHRNFLLLQSVKGVGAIVAINTLIKTNNFEWFTNAREFACCCGLAPFEHTSGSSIRGRTRVSHMADKQMKTLFDLAAKVAIRYDPEMKAYYERRVSEGKAKMSAINVVRNKIVGRMFAVIKRQTPYKSAYLSAA
jgi:transposase